MSSYIKYMYILQNMTEEWVYFLFKWISKRQNGQRPLEIHKKRKKEDSHGSGRDGIKTMMALCML